MLLCLVISCEDQEMLDLDCSETAFNLEVVAQTVATCGRADGSLTVTTVFGNNPAVTYSIDGINFQQSNMFEGLAPGTYTVEAKTDQGCQAAEEVTIEENKTVTLDVEGVGTSGCNSSSGEITVAASEPGFRYRINGGALQESGTFSGLAAGTYLVEAQNADGCTVAKEVQVLTGVSYENTIKSIIQTNCATENNCHGADSPNITKLSSLAEIQALADRVKARTSAQSMPPGDRDITQEEIDLIACWVDDGALDN